MTVQEMKLLIQQIPTDSLTMLKLLIDIELLGRGITPDQDNPAVETAKSRLLDESACFDSLFDRIRVPFISQV